MRTKKEYPNKYTLEFGEKVKELRIKQHMSQDELAQAVGYKDRASISRIEKGFTDVYQNKIKALADALSTSPAYLMGWTSIESKSEYEKYQTMRNEIAHLLDDDFSIEELKQVYDYANFLLSKKSK